VLLSQITQRSVQTDFHAVQLSKQEKAQAELETILEAEKKRYWAERLLLYFDCRDLLGIPHNLNKLLEDKTSEDYNPARQLSRKMLTKAHEIQDVAIKFQSQLRNITQSQTDVIEVLTERCGKAVIYFQKETVNGMLLPLQEYINNFNIKKAKTYHKNLCNLEQDIKLFIENMKKARYNDVPLIKIEIAPLPDREAINRNKTLQPIAKPAQPVTKPTQQSSEKHLGSNSAKQTLELFREGLSIDEIAQTRNLSKTTLTQHLAEYVQKGDIPVADLVSQDIIDALTPWVQAAIAEDNLFLRPIREAAGEEFSYDDIRFVMSHCLYEKNKNNEAIVKF
jgi:hypothetical protein